MRADGEPRATAIAATATTSARPDRQRGCTLPIAHRHGLLRHVDAHHAREVAHDQSSRHQGHRAPTAQAVFDHLRPGQAAIAVGVASAIDSTPSSSST